MKLEEIVNKLLAKNPRDRYQNIMELPVDLKNVTRKCGSWLQAAASKRLLRNIWRGTFGTLLDNVFVRYGMVSDPNR